MNSEPESNAWDVFTLDELLSLTGYSAFRAKDEIRRRIASLKREIADSYEACRMMEDRLNRLVGRHD